MQSLERVIDPGLVVQRLTHPHEDDVAEASPFSGQDLASSDDLIDDFLHHRGCG